MSHMRNFSLWALQRTGNLREAHGPGHVRYALVNASCLAYLDDVISFGVDASEALARLNEAQER